MPQIPDKLEEILDELDQLDQAERAEYLLELSDEFEEVPERVATRPFPNSHRVQKCESEAYIWVEDRDDGTLDFHYAVENPQGISAKAVAAILKETLSGEPLEEVASVSPEILQRIFGRQLSMGKGEGLSGIIELSAGEARRRLRVARQG
jgi:cysteine desulfuration protein SufE